MAKSMLVTTRQIGWVECIKNMVTQLDPLACAINHVNAWANEVLNPCRIVDRSCLDPTTCGLGGCTGTARKAECTTHEAEMIADAITALLISRNVCDACPQSCDRTLCVCMDTTTTTTTIPCSCANCTPGCKGMAVCQVDDAGTSPVDLTVHYCGTLGPNGRFCWHTTACDPKVNCADGCIDAQYASPPYGNPLHWPGAGVCYVDITSYYDGWIYSDAGGSQLFPFVWICHPQ